MKRQSRLVRALCAALAIAAATAMAAETDHAWRFDTSGRAAVITTPVEAAGTSAVALESPSCVERTCHGIVTPGLYVIFR